MENASLEEFLDTGGESERDGEGDSGTSDADETGAEHADETGAEHAAGSRSSDRATAPADVAPATPTLEWSSAGADCDSCGTEVRRRWNSGAGLVCADCKEW